MAASNATASSDSEPAPQAIQALLMSTLQESTESRPWSDLQNRSDRTLLVHQHPNFHFDFDNLPISISNSYAKILQKDVAERGKVWYPENNDIDIEFLVLPRNSEAVLGPRSISCDSKSAVEEALQVLLRTYILEANNLIYMP